jgi:hypothetical protein
MGTRSPISMTSPAPAVPSPGSPSLSPDVEGPTSVPTAAALTVIPRGVTLTSKSIVQAPTPAPVTITTMGPIDFSVQSDMVPKVLQPLVATKATKSEVVIVSEPLNVPSIKWEVHVDPVLLKAHTSYSLEEKEPEIFEVVSQLLTPYLHKLLGEPLLAYNLQVAYGESTPANNDPEIIVTHFEVKIILQYLSDSIESYRNPVQGLASDYLLRFFEGTERYQLLGELRLADINVNEIVLEEEDFLASVFDDDTINQVQGTGSNNNQSSSNDEKDKTGMFAAIGAGSFVLVALMYTSFQSRRRRRRITQLRLGDSYSDSESRDSARNSTDELQVVSNEQEAKRQRFAGGFGRFFRKENDENEVSSRNSSDEHQVASDEPEEKRQRFSGGFGRFFRKENDENEIANSSRSSSAELQVVSDEPEEKRQRFSGGFGRFFRKENDENEIANSSRSSSAELQVASDEPEEKRQRFSGGLRKFFTRGNAEPEDSDEPKTRQRSYSGSFRRFPAGSIRPAAIQKEPAFSKDVLKSSPGLSGLAPPSIEDESEAPSSAPRLSTFDDQSYSVAGDYNIPTEYDVRASPLPSVYGGGRHGNTRGAPDLQDDEFSMPDQYSVAPSMMNDEFSMPSQSVMGSTRRPKSKASSPEHPFGWSSPKAYIINSPPGQQGVLKSDISFSVMDGEDVVESPMSDVLMDEWSVDSYCTRQTPQTSHQSTTPPIKAGWTKPKKGSARSRQKERQDESSYLNMPALS